jgi:hypothetical protein
VASLVARKYKGRGETTEPWEEVFLKEYVEKSGISLSAKAAGTTWQTVYKHRDESPRFAELLETAKMEMIENLERKLMRLSWGEKGNFLAIIARLKAELPNKYNDKLQVSGAIGHLHAPVPAAEIAALLKAYVEDSTPETRAAIRGEVIDVEATVIESNAADSPDEPQKPA